MAWITFWTLKMNFTFFILLDAEDEFDIMNNGGEHVAAEMERVEDLGAEMQGVEEVAAEMKEVEDVGAEIQGIKEVVAEMEEVEDAVAEMQGVEDFATDGEEVHHFDVLTAGEQVIFDVMFDIHHPNIYFDNNGFYRYREE
jgi:hypothetical protein